MKKRTFLVILLLFIASTLYTYAVEKKTWELQCENDPMDGRWCVITEGSIVTLGNKVFGGGLIVRKIDDGSEFAQIYDLQHSLHPKKRSRIKVDNNAPLTATSDGILIGTNYHNLVSQLKAGNSALLRINIWPGGQYDITITLKKFTKQYILMISEWEKGKK